MIVVWWDVLKWIKYVAYSTINPKINAYNSNAILLESDNVQMSYEITRKIGITWNNLFERIILKWHALNVNKYYLVHYKLCTLGSQIEAKKANTRSLNHIRAPYPKDIKRKPIRNYSFIQIWYTWIYASNEFEI